MGEVEMVRFYDPVNVSDQTRVEELLRSKGIEYCVNRDTSGGDPGEILVAEEDLPAAEELVRSWRAAAHYSRWCRQP